jgi:hypothetical protein
MGLVHKRRLPLLILVFVAVLVACNTGQDDSDQPNPTPAEATEASQPTVNATPELFSTAETTVAVVVSTPEFQDAQRNDPDTTIGPIPTAPPPIPSDFDSDGDGFYNSDEFVQAITTLYPSYAWPDRYYLGLDAIIEQLESRLQPNMSHEVPGEYTVIGGWHQCAWQLAFLDAFSAGDDALMAETLTRLRWGLEFNPLTPRATIASREEMYDRAELGDVAQVQQSTTVNCDPDDFTARPPASPVVVRPWLGAWALDRRDVS